jgi:hypothetical protein
VGCTTVKGPDDPVTGDDDDAPDCLVDDDCGSAEICEEAFCVEGDRDNAFADATPILQNEPHGGVIVPAGDVDTYAYTSLGPEWLRIETTTIGDPLYNLDTVVRVFAANGAEHAVMDNFPTGRVSTYDTVLIVYLPRADTWYVTVEDVTTYYTAFFTEDEHRGGSDFTYELSLEGDVGTTSESDSSTDPSATVEISTGASIWYVGVNLETPGDSDFLTLDLPFEGYPLDVFGHSDIPGSPARARVRLFDPSGALALEKDDLGDEGQASYFDPVAGDWLLEATDVDGAGSDDSWYVVYVRSYEEGAYHPYFGYTVYEDEVEPNDDRSDAVPLTLVESLFDTGDSYHGQYLQGRFDDVGDEDWFVVTTDLDEKVTVRCFSELFGSLADLQVGLFDGDFEITPADQGLVPTDLGQYLWNVEVPGPGAYSVRLTSPSAVFGAGAYYRCRILQSTLDFATE